MCIRDSLYISSSITRLTYIRVCTTSCLSHANTCIFNILRIPNTLTTTCLKPLYILITRKYAYSLRYTHLKVHTALNSLRAQEIRRILGRVATNTAFPVSTHAAGNCLRSGITHNRQKQAYMHKRTTTTKEGRTKSTQITGHNSYNQINDRTQIVPLDHIHNNHEE